MTRIGKIARLPRDIRDQLNRRLYDGECGRHLLEWLNAQPAVLALMHRDFAGREISDQNLSEWKQAGYRDWAIQQEALVQIAEQSANVEELARVGRGRISDNVATILMAHYAVEISTLTGEDNPESRRKLRVLRDLSRQVALHRRGDHNAALLCIKQAREDRTREQTEEELSHHFQRWLKFTKVREAIRKEPKSPEAELAQTRKALGLTKNTKPASE